MTSHAVRRSKQTDITFPIRVKIRVPGNGFGNVIHDMHVWLNDNVGADNYGTASITGSAGYYFRNIQDASAFLAAFPLLELDNKVKQLGLQ